MVAALEKERDTLRAERDQAYADRDKVDRYYQNDVTELKGKLETIRAAEKAATDMLCELWDKLGTRSMESEQTGALDRIRDLSTLNQQLARAAELLRELHATVQGECPSLLNEDSGGSARLAIGIDEFLASLKGKEGAP